MKAPHHTPHDSEDEIVLDAESGEEVVAEETELTANALKDKLKTLRDELKKYQKERDENLAGWQRAKADLVNFRRSVEEDRVRDAARARGKVVRALIPALDSFDGAMSTTKWQDVDATWRDGVERIAGQFHKALEDEGLVSFGVVGELFDPTHHECMSVQTTDDESEDHTIAQVLQKGYAIGDEVVRPAKVVVFQHN